MKLLHIKQTYVTKLHTGCRRLFFFKYSLCIQYQYGDVISDSFESMTYKDMGMNPTKKPGFLFGY